MRSEAAAAVGKVHLAVQEQRNKPDISDITMKIILGY
jgi:hypothetical protein